MTKAKASLVGRVGSGLLIGLATILCLSVVGAWFPSLPYLAFGQLIVEWFGPWVVILLVVTAIQVGRRWMRQRRRRDLAVAGVCTGAAAGAAFIVVVQLLAIHSSGIQVNLARSLYAGPMPHRSLPPVVEVYARDQGQPVPLAIYRPAPDTSKRPAPVLVYIHGGGWVSGRYSVRDADLRWFADQGIVAVSVEYPLSTADRHLWDQTHGQIGCALAWVTRNISRYGGDPERVVLMGESAGGNLALNVGYMTNQGTLQPNCPGTLPHVAAVVSLYPVIDVAEFYRIETASLSTTSRDMTEAYTGGTPQEFPARYASVSPASHISPSAPPTVLIVGGADTLVPSGPAHAFADKAAAGGIDIQLIDLPFAGHAFDILSGSLTNQLVRNATIRVMNAQGMAVPAE